MNAPGNKLRDYRDKFRRLDRKWHVLIGAQLFFVVATFRYNRAQRRFEEQQQQQQQQQLPQSQIPPSAATNPSSSSSSSETKRE